MARRTDSMKWIGRWMMIGPALLVLAILAVIGKAWWLQQPTQGLERPVPVEPIAPVASGRSDAALFLASRPRPFVTQSAQERRSVAWADHVLHSPTDCVGGRLYAHPPEGGGYLLTDSQGHPLPCNQADVELGTVDGDVRGLPSGHAQITVVSKASVYPRATGTSDTLASIPRAQRRPLSLGETCVDGYVTRDVDGESVATTQRCADGVAFTDVR